MLYPKLRTSVSIARLARPLFDRRQAAATARNDTLDERLAEKAVARAALERDADLIEDAARRTLARSQEMLRPLVDATETRLTGTARQEAWAPLYAAVRAIQVLERRASGRPGLRLVAERLRADPVLHPPQIALVCFGRADDGDAATPYGDGCGLVHEKPDWRLRTGHMYCDACVDQRKRRAPERRHQAMSRKDAPSAPEVLNRLGVDLYRGRCACGNTVTTRVSHRWVCDRCLSANPVTPQGR
jgi:hypothetical protein